MASFTKKAKEKFGFGKRTKKKTQSVPKIASISHSVAAPGELIITDKQHVEPAPVLLHEETTSLTQPSTHNKAKGLTTHGAGLTDGTKQKTGKSRNSKLMEQPPGTLRHVVCGQETLARIAAHYDVTTSQITKINKLMCRTVFPGQLLYVPDKDFVPVISDSSGSGPSTNLADPIKSKPTPVNIPSNQVEVNFNSGMVSPGHAERLSPPFPMESVLSVAHSLTEEEAQKLDEECYERFIKINCKQITGDKGSVRGVLLVTPNAIMFDPDVMDPLVEEHGADVFGLMAPMEMVISVAMYHDISHMKFTCNGLMESVEKRSVSPNKAYHAPGCELNKGLSLEQDSPDEAEVLLESCDQSENRSNDDLDFVNLPDVVNMENLQPTSSKRNRTVSECSCGALQQVMDSQTIPTKDKTDTIAVRSDELEEDKIGNSLEPVGEHQHKMQDGDNDQNVDNYEDNKTLDSVEPDVIREAMGDVETRKPANNDVTDSEGETHNSRPVNSQSNTDEPVNNNIVNTELVNSGLVNTEPVNSNIVNTELVNSDLVNSEPINSELVNSELVNSDLVNSEPINSNIVNTELVNGDLVISEPINSEIVNIEPVNSGSQGNDFTFNQKSQDPEPDSEVNVVPIEKESTINDSDIHVEVNERSGVNEGSFNEGQGQGEAVSPSADLSVGSDQIAAPMENKPTYPEMMEIGDSEAVTEATESMGHGLQRKITGSIKKIGSTTSGGIKMVGTATTGGIMKVGSATTGSIKKMANISSSSFNAFVDFSSGLFSRSQDECDKVKDIQQLPQQTSVSPEIKKVGSSKFYTGTGSCDGNIQSCDHKSPGPRRESGGSAIIKDSNHQLIKKPLLRSAISLDDKPDLFQSIDELMHISKPAIIVEPPLFLCLRIGVPINKTVSKTCPIESYNKNRKKPQYWFSIPRDRVDQLYAFFIQWSPSLYGDEDEIDPKERGFVVLDWDEYDHETELDTLEMSSDHFEREMNRKRSTFKRAISKDWEIVKIEEARRYIPDLDVEGSLPPPELVGDSIILETSHIEKLSRSLPARAEGYPWTLVYTTEAHGFSIKTMFRLMENVDSPILLLVKDTDQHVFGAITSCEFKISEHFYGRGETFLFTFQPDFLTYKWTGDNSFFIKSNLDSLAIGAGKGVFGLWLDADFYHGRTEQCETFNNEPLTVKHDFLISAVECWAFD